MCKPLVPCIVHFPVQYHGTYFPAFLGNGKFAVFARSKDFLSLPHQSFPHKYHCSTMQKDLLPSLGKFLPPRDTLIGSARA